MRENLLLTYYTHNRAFVVSHGNAQPHHQFGALNSTSLTLLIEPALVFEAQKQKKGPLFSGMESQYHPNNNF